MALSFSCEHCGAPIVVNFLCVGETARCRSCGRDTVVSDKAMETDAPPLESLPDATAAHKPESEASEEPLEVPLEVEQAREFQGLLRNLTPHAYLTYVLIGINVAIFVVMIVRGVGVLEPDTGSLIAWGADFGPLTTNGQWWRLFTSMFLHIGIIHILMNMFVLWNIGTFIERLVGQAGFLAVYLASGLGGSLVSTLTSPYTVSAGASGAIFGLYGCLLGFLALNRDSFPSSVLKPLTKGAMTFVFYNIVYGLGRSGVDLAAHLGGLATGFAFGLILSQPIELEAARRRGVRSAIVAAGAIALLATGALALPHVTDLEAEMSSFAAMEHNVIDAYQKALSKAKNGEFSDEQFAKAIESTVLPDWKSSREHLAKLSGLPAQQKQFLDLLGRYLAARQEGWEFLVKALRDQNPAAFQESEAKQKEAEDRLKELQAFTGKT